MQWMQFNCHLVVLNYRKLVQIITWPHAVQQCEVNQFLLLLLAHLTSRLVLDHD